jgi:uncharacterized SAM-binding protein YcdF (DUF218 family)
MKPKDLFVVHSLSKTLFEYLYLQEEPSEADAIMGFGHFDAKIPLHCGKLYSQGYAGLIIFSGGVGAGSTGLKKPEAREFHDKLRLQFPKIPSEKVVIEDRSTNTGENIRFTFFMLRQNYREFADIKKLIIVANGYRQRRVWLTCLKNLPNVELINSPPLTTFEEELEMFTNAGENFYIHLLNEIERIITYPDKGFIERTDIPFNIISISEKLRKMINYFKL